MKKNHSIYSSVGTHGKEKKQEQRRTLAITMIVMFMSLLFAACTTGPICTRDRFERNLIEFEPLMHGRDR